MKAKTSYRLVILFSIIISLISVISLAGTIALSFRNNLLKNDIENFIYDYKNYNYKSKLEHLNPLENSSNKSTTKYHNNLNNETIIFTPEIAYSYLKNYFKNNDEVVFSNILGEEFYNGEKFYVARLFSKELLNTVGAHGGNTLLISSTGEIFDELELIN